MTVSRGGGGEGAADTAADMMSQEWIMSTLTSEMFPIHFRHEITVQLHVEKKNNLKQSERLKCIERTFRISNVLYFLFLV